MRASYVAVLVEEPSMEKVLRHLLPRIAGDPEFDIITFQGKEDLLENLPFVLNDYARWFGTGERVLVLVDRDDDDCLLLKGRLDEAALKAGLSLCRVGARSPGSVLNRVVCTELEAWFIGDVEALRKNYPRVPRSLDQKDRFRDPDAIDRTWEALEKVLQDAGYHRAGLAKLRLAEDVAPYLDLQHNRSASFRAFLSGVRYLVEGAA